jgi:hypothetical protein
LRGCATSDTPIARHARPASAGRATVADGGKRGSLHVGEVDAGALEHHAVLDQPRDPAAAFGTIPRIARERPAVERPRSARRRVPAAR